WEQRKLGEVVSVFDGTHQTPNYKNKGIMFLSVENINTLLSNKFISENEYRQRFKIKPRYLDVFMTRIGTIGKTNVITTHKPIAYYVSLALLRPQNIQSFFLSFIIQTSKVQQDIWKRTLQIAFPQKINKDEIGKVTLAVPLQKEQIDIEKLLLKLDKLVTLQQRKLNQLKRLKTAMLQQLFTDKNSKQPNLRFKNFRGDWEQRKLKSVVSVNSGKDYKSLEKGNIPVYGTGGYIASVSKFLSSQDAIGLGRKGTINKPYILKAPFWTVDTLFYLTLKPENILTFIYSLIQKINWLQYDESTGLPSLSKKNIENVLVSLTKLDEQQKIGKVIVKLDKFITLQQSKIDQLTILKKYLLQKLFI
ncbi:restriction endonuclease subunit S, partial [Limosilactobacillus reuteri]|uniref:restriction endonuclease subunit S n=1 Tax=Limosilactobacillus reuteri TaxID=1598 RepID=UPI001E5CF5E1